MKKTPQRALPKRSSKAQPLSDRVRTALHREELATKGVNNLSDAQRAELAEERAEQRAEEHADHKADERATRT